MGYAFGQDTKAPWKSAETTPVLYFENTALVLTPVSYTHLDVYKRQGQEREREITVGDGAPIRTLLGRAVGIDVDPLVVERGIGEEVDAVLILSLIHI